MPAKTTDHLVSVVVRSDAATDGIVGRGRNAIGKKIGGRPNENANMPAMRGRPCRMARVPRILRRRQPRRRRSPFDLFQTRGFWRASWRRSSQAIWPIRSSLSRACFSINRSVTTSALKSETVDLFQLGENGSVASDQRVLENGAFLSEKNRFYRTEVTQTRANQRQFYLRRTLPLERDFVGSDQPSRLPVATAQPLRAAFQPPYEFPGIPAANRDRERSGSVERWKEEARSLTTYVTLQEDPPITFNSVAETERHFRQTHLPTLLRSGKELTIDGVVSRRLPDRSLGRVIEQAWAQEFRSPAKMMQELSNAFRQGALQIFRHRKSMLFVSSIRARPFNLSSSSLSSSIAGVLAALTEAPGINRKQLLEKLQPETDVRSRSARTK